jgi:N-acetylglucosamine-6-phosphate deacetylase
MNTLIFTNADCVFPHGTAKTNLICSDGRIAAFDPAGTAEKAPEGTVLDCGGHYLCPGFIDLHVHGGGDADFMDGGRDAIIQACRTHADHGTTTIYPTTLCAPDEELYAFFADLEAVCATPTGRMIGGVHLEGPYIAVSQKGAQDERFVRLPTPDHYLPMLDACRRIRRVTAAPEVPGALEFGSRLAERSILASIGHTDANYSDILTAMRHGYSHLTHFYSGMGGLVREQGYRVLGAIESGYLLDDLTVEIIADGKHMPPELLRLIYKVKGADRIALVTDAMRAAGTDHTVSVLGSRKNGLEVFIDDDVAKMPDRTAFAGSIATADRLVRNMIRLVGVPVHDAVKMMTLTPARIMGIQSRKGSLAAGKDADLVLLNRDDLKVEMTVVGGEIVYRR